MESVDTEDLVSMCEYAQCWNLKIGCKDKKLLEMAVDKFIDMIFDACCRPSSSFIT
jgi:hypothetical protein